jgi:peptidoglycan/LPS O-acetylase OafA/YrhL
VSQRGELRYEPGLDGLRGVAVLAVLLYHGGVAWAHGGFLGVEAFFVLSGFLITSLLVAEWRRDETIHLKDFWARRARRLLPALLAVVVVCAIYETVLGASRAAPDFGAQGLSTLLYVANWHQIWTGSGYFAQAAVVSPLQHAWSLAIEEQFYLVWPLVVLGVLRTFGGRALRVLLGIAVVGCALSNLETVWLYHGGAGLDRVYYGTDTRASGLLVGAALAVALALRSTSGTDVAATSFGPRTRVAIAVAGVAGAVGYGVMFTETSGTSGWLFSGGWLAVDAGVGAVILAACSSDRWSPVRAVLASPPLRAAGVISYGLYLWHFPLMAWLTTSSTGLSGVGLLWLRLAASAAAAGISYVLIEQPIRRRRIRGVALAVVAPIGVCLALGAVSLAWVTGSSVAVVAVVTHPPHRNGSCRVDVGAAGVKTYHVCPPIRVLIVGDSIGLTLGLELGMHQDQYGAVLHDSAELGCGFTNRGELDQFGTGWGPPAAHCADELAQWKAEEEQFHPQAIVVEMGYWNELDWLQNGRAVNVTQPGYASQVAGGVRKLIATLGSPHVPVVLVSVPLVNPGPWPGGEASPQGSLARHDAINAILEQVASRGTSDGVPVSYFDLAPYVAPHNRYAASVGGGLCRMSDGVHFYVGVYPALVRTPCGANIQRTLLTELRSMLVGSRGVRPVT